MTIPLSLAFGQTGPLTHTGRCTSKTVPTKGVRPVPLTLIRTVGSWDNITAGTQTLHTMGQTRVKYQKLGEENFPCRGIVPSGSQFRLKDHLNSSGTNPTSINGTFRPLNVSLTGPSTVNNGAEGTWTASSGGGNTPGASYTFKWYYRAGSGSWTQVRSITKSSHTDSYTRVAGSSNFEIEARVTRAGLTVSKAIQVTVGGGGGEDRIAEASPIASNLGIASDFQLAQNYPNPFNPNTEIAFVLPEMSPVRLVVYDVLGKEVARLVDNTLDAGPHSVSFDAGSLPSGMYIYRIEAGTFTEAKHMTLLK